MLTRAAPPAPLPPRPLIDAIEAGECVAFVGAGFSAAAVPSWSQLLERVARHEQTGPGVRERVLGLLAGPRPTARDFETAAQCLRDDVGDDAFTRLLALQVGSPQATDAMEARLHRLRGVPFRAILTTNFDGFLRGPVPGRDAYLHVLRSSGHRWWNRRFWDRGGQGSFVVKLHGDMSVEPPASIVITQRDYRRRLYRDPGYTTFLRSVFATFTVLYLGFSFTDAYLNELRSEILALLEYEGGDQPIAYALINDVADDERDYLARHDGIEVLTYSTHGGTDYSGFDRYLDAIYQRTNPRYLLGALLAHRRILWADPVPRNNEYAMYVLQQATRIAGGQECGIEQVATPDDAIAHLENHGPPDLLITHWGHRKAAFDGQVCANAQRLLGLIRQRGLQCPVLVFSTGHHADDNKRAALRAGAIGYTFRWETLFQEIARIFEDGERTG